MCGVPVTNGMTRMIDLRMNVTGNAHIAVEALEGAVRPEVLDIWLERTATSWFRRRAAQRFMTQGDDAVGAWAPSPESTKKRRARQRLPEYPPNIRTNEMVTWATTVDGSSWNGGLYWPGYVPTGNLGDKIKVAQEGNPKLGAPARPIIGVSTVDSQILTESLNSYIIRVGRRVLHVNAPNPETAWKIEKIPLTTVIGEARWAAEQMAWQTQSIGATFGFGGT